MKYEYGVKYPVLCEKPDDLPDDVEVECFSKNSLKWYSGKRAASERDWSGTILFRIVDERYKPKEQDMNYYNPTVGDVVIAIDKRVKSDGNKCELRYMGADVCVLYDIYDDCEFAVHPCHVEFLPICTETENLVEQMERDIKGRTNLIFSTELLKTLIDANYRKIKPMSETEFVFAAINFGISGQGAKHLFNQGCRFLDGGNDAS